MKYKTTVKELKEGYYNIIPAHYCELQSLLQYKKPVAYSSGTYGWKFDVYEFDGVAIVTGYNPPASKNSKVSYELVKEYETKSQGKTKEEKDILIKEFINKSVNN